MNKTNRKYNAEYISYVESGVSAAVFIARDIAKNCPTDHMWIDVISKEGRKRKDNRWDFTVFTVELFPRKTRPVYPQYASDDDKKYITWATAHEDINKQRRQGYHGPRYEIRPRLINRNNGKYTIRKVKVRGEPKIDRVKVSEKGWLPGTWIPTVKEKWVERKIATYKYVDKKVPVKPRWEYAIISVKRI